MAKVALVTDSAASLPASLRAQYDIEVVPLNLVFDDHSYPDGLESNGQFYQALKTARRPPTTTSASPGTHLEALRRAASKAPSVLCVTVSSQFSGTHDAAVKGAQMLREECPDVAVEVLDSQSATMAEGFVVIEAARLAATGAELPEVVAHARDVISRVGIIAVIDTLEYLARGGRVPRIKAWASALLSVKPIIELRQQDIHLVTRARTRQRAVEQLIPILEQRGLRGQKLHLCVQHTNALEDAERLAKEAAGRLHPAEVAVSEFTLVMGAHTGPGLLGLAYYVEP
ncbi:MAG: DegV family protein [Acidobacteria bacterium]|nr:DegV family protein [Acidobacteriota bacterium]